MTVFCGHSDELHFLGIVDDLLRLDKGGVAVSIVIGIAVIVGNNIGCICLGKLTHDLTELLHINRAFVRRFRSGCFRSLCCAYFGRSGNTADTCCCKHESSHHSTNHSCFHHRPPQSKISFVLRICCFAEIVYLIIGQTTSFHILNLLMFFGKHGF